jgi:hypothetical protein
MQDNVTPVFKDFSYAGGFVRMLSIVQPGCLFCTNAKPAKNVHGGFDRMCGALGRRDMAVIEEGTAIVFGTDSSSPRET